MDVGSRTAQLCIEGTRAEFEHRISDARSLFRQAWAAVVDDYDASIAAHYIAHLEPDAKEALRWNLIALEHGRLDERSEEFIGSLLVSVGGAYEALGQLGEAERHFALAAECGVNHVPLTRRETSVSMRAATVDDVVAIERLIDDTIEASYRGIYPDRAIEYFKKLHRRDGILTRIERGSVLVAHRDTELVGTGSLVEGEIGGVFVLHRLHGHGIGSLLMDELETLASAKGLVAVSLCVSLPSRGFYERRAYLLSSLISADMGEGQTLDYWEAHKPLAPETISAQTDSSEWPPHAAGTVEP